MMLRGSRGGAEGYSPGASPGALPPLIFLQNGNGAIAENGNGAIAENENGAIAGYPSAGINRHAVGNERVLQERSSEPPDLESCGGGREAVVEA